MCDRKSREAGAGAEYPCRHDVDGAAASSAVHLESHDTHSRHDCAGT